MAGKKEEKSKFLPNGSSVEIPSWMRQAVQLANADTLVKLTCTTIIEGEMKYFVNFIVSEKIAAFVERYIKDLLNMEKCLKN